MRLDRIWALLVAVAWIAVGIGAALAFSRGAGSAEVVAGLRRWTWPVMPLLALAAAGLWAATAPGRSAAAVVIAFAAALAVGGLVDWLVPRIPFAAILPFAVVALGVGCVIMLRATPAMSAALGGTAGLILGGVMFAGQAPRAILAPGGLGVLLGAVLGSGLIAMLGALLWRSRGELLVRAAGAGVALVAAALYLTR